MQRTICGLHRLCRDADLPACFAFYAKSFTISPCPCLSYKSPVTLRFSPVRRLASSTSLRAGENDEDLLLRCRSYGIRTRLELDRQSNFDVPIENDKILVDDVVYRRDLNLWNILLDYRTRYYGSQGATTIWRGLKYRGPRVDLESDDELTNVLWSKLLQCAAEHNDLNLTKRLCERNGIAWNRPKLFAETISTLLRAGRDFQVGVMCHRLKGKHQDGIVDILDLYETFKPQVHRELKAFCSVYEKVHPDKIYGKSVPRLLLQNRPDEAFLLHRFLISRGDFPTSFGEIEPFMRHLARKSEDPGPFLRSLAASGVVFTGQGRRVHEHESREVAVGTDKAPKGKGSETLQSNKVSDTFAAKAFATRALSFEFTLNALRAFGLTEIGPQSMREMGLSASGIDEFSSHLTKLDTLGIDTGGSAYSRFVRKVCSAKEATLLQQALRTDMHHDVFEDMHLQQRLLVESFNRCDWSKVNLLLAMLNHGQASQLSDSARFEFLSSIANDDMKVRSFLTVVSNQVGPGKGLSIDLLQNLADHLISRLQDTGSKDLRSRHEQRSRALFTAGVLQECVGLGAQVTVGQWKTLFSRLGKSGALGEVKTLAIWLAVWHSEQAGDLVVKDQSTTKRTTSLDWIFDQTFQGAIVYWALKEQFRGRSSGTRQPWQMTLALLHYLETDCGVPSQLGVTRKVIVLFVRGLYRRSESGLTSHRPNTRRTDSKKLCNRLLKTLDEFWPRNVALTRSEHEAVNAYLSEEKAHRASDAAIVSRTSFETALRRFPFLEARRNEWDDDNQSATSTNT